MFTVSSFEDVTCLQMDRIILGRRSRTAYAFLVDGLAIECGPSQFKRQLRQFYHENLPQQAVFSHSHEDHAGNVDLLNQLGIIPYIHQGGVAKIQSVQSLPLYRRIVWGSPAVGDCQPIPNWIETDQYTFNVLHTPGHALEHICLYEENEGWLFTGDLYVGEKIIYLYDQEDLKALKDTLRLLAKLPFSTMFCSHRGPLNKGPEALARKLAYIETLEQKAHSMHKQGLSQREITANLLGKENYMYFISGGEFSKTALITAILDEIR